MKISFLAISLSVLFFFTFSGTVLSQFPASVDSVYAFIKYNSIYRKDVNWDTIDAAFKVDLADSKSLHDTMNCFVNILKQLKDVHSQMFLNNQYYGHYPSFDDKTMAWLKPLTDQSNQMVNIIKTETLPLQFFYILVPGVQAKDQSEINTIAQALYDSIYQIKLKGVHGLIIDLRLNGGGNIYPMLSGLSALLGETDIAYETNADDQVVRKWSLHNGNFILGDYHTTAIKRSADDDLSDLPVAILLGPVTRSSGSITAIAFKKRKKTIFIGEPTADGYTTSNGYFQFAPNLVFNFATNFVADREMNIYKKTVEPDIWIYHGDDLKDWKKDSKIKTALNWLLKN